MRAVVYDAPRQFSVREIPKPQPGPGEVRIKVVQTGVGRDQLLRGCPSQCAPVMPALRGLLATAFPSLTSGWRWRPFAGIPRLTTSSSPPRRQKRWSP